MVRQQRGFTTARSTTRTTNVSPSSTATIKRARAFTPIASTRSTGDWMGFSAGNGVGLLRFVDGAKIGWSSRLLEPPRLPLPCLAQPARQPRDNRRSGGALCPCVRCGRHHSGADLYHPEVVYLSPTTRLFGQPRRIEGVEPTLAFIQLTIAACENIAYRPDQRAVIPGGRSAYTRIVFDWDAGHVRLRSIYVVVYRYRKGASVSRSSTTTRAPSWTSWEHPRAELHGDEVLPPLVCGLMMTRSTVTTHAHHFREMMTPMTTIYYEHDADRQP